MDVISFSDKNLDFSYYYTWFLELNLIFRRNCSTFNNTIISYWNWNDIGFGFRIDIDGKTFASAWDLHRLHGEALLDCIMTEDES